MRSIKFTPNSFEEFLSWRSKDPKLFEKIVALIEDVQRHPFEGIGKPEPLKHQLRGFWSRRINSEHRLVYEVDGEVITVIKCQGHYKA